MEVSRPENGGGGAGSNGSYILKRREEKYQLDLGRAAFLRREVERHLPLFEFRKGNPCTHITTIYLDTEKLDFYEKARSYYDDNIKLRVKEYYYQHETPSLDRGRHEDANRYCLCFDSVFVEIKERIHGLVVKRRFELPKPLLGRLLRAQDVWDELVASRSGIEFNECVDVYRDFRWYVQRYQVFPKSIINYRRSVYQEDEHQLRITFDDEMAVFEPPVGLYENRDTLARFALEKPIRVFPHVTLEIKCQNGHPDWLSKLLETQRPRKISKFTTSMNVLAQELPRLAAGGALKDTHLEDSGASGDTTQVSELKL